MSSALEAVALWTLFSSLILISLLYLFKGLLAKGIGRAIGNYLKSRTQDRRDTLFNLARQENEKQPPSTHHQKRKSEDLDWEKVEGKVVGRQNEQKEQPTPDPTWKGIIGFFHPFCNAGGGGERVLWAAIRATQQKWPNALCVVYTGDHDVDKKQILERVENRFNIHLHPPTVTFLYLSTRRYVLSSTWPRFTLLGQSLGSLILAYDAFNLMVPDIFVDTMGYAFALSLSKLLFPTVPTGAYVHYPTISTDMLGSLDSVQETGSTTRGLNAGAGRGWKGLAKKQYWRLFARLYGWIGSSIDVVMTNSSWTQSHIHELWGPGRGKKPSSFPIEVVFPPVAVEEIEREVPVDAASEQNREPTLLYIAQFRPEKNHQLILSAFARFLRENPTKNSGEEPPHLLLVGSVRDSADETYIYSLRLLAHELHITSSVTFLLNASWPDVLARLRTCSVGVNAMWNEHFGIGVVEYQAAGLVCVVNDSGGPKRDIVVECGGGPTGFHASSEAEYAEAFGKALSLKHEEVLSMRRRARLSARRFGEAAFDASWLVQMERLVGLQRNRTRI